MASNVFGIAIHSRSRHRSDNSFRTWYSMPHQRPNLHFPGATRCSSREDGGCRQPPAQFFVPIHVRSSVSRVAFTCEHYQFVCRRQYKEDKPMKSFFNIRDLLRSLEVDPITAKDPVKRMCVCDGDFLTANIATGAEARSSLHTQPAHASSTGHAPGLSLRTGSLECRSYARRPML